MIMTLERQILESSARSGAQRRGMVVTRDEEELVEVDGGTIEIVPAWRFLLMMDEIE